MQRYEVIREIYNACGGKYMLDTGFIDEIESDDITKNIDAWFKGNAKYTVETQSDGSIVYYLTEPQKQKITFCKF